MGEGALQCEPVVGVREGGGQRGGVSSSKVQVTRVDQSAARSFRMLFLASSERMRVPRLASRRWVRNGSYFSSRVASFSSCLCGRSQDAEYKLTRGIETHPHLGPEECVAQRDEVRVLRVEHVEGAVPVPTRMSAPTHQKTGKKD